MTPPAPPAKSREPLLDPVERISEIIYALIMALTFTGTLGVATAGRDEVRTMLFGVIGCNAAWGIIDGVMYLLARMAERGRDHQRLQRLRRPDSPEMARAALLDSLPAAAADLLGPEDIDRLRARLAASAPAEPTASLRREDWLGAGSLFLHVLAATFPVVLPFLFIHPVALALRISNGVAVGLLFLSGCLLGHYAGHRPWRTGLLMVLVGVALITIAIALGG